MKENSRDLLLGLVQACLCPETGELSGDLLYGSLAEGVRLCGIRSSQASSGSDPTIDEEFVHRGVCHHALHFIDKHGHASVNRRLHASPIG